MDLSIARGSAGRLRRWRRSRPRKNGHHSIANPGVGIGDRPVVACSAWSLLHQGQLEEEFRPDGIEIKWTFARGAGPAVNEQLTSPTSAASELVDHRALERAQDPSVGRVRADERLPTSRSRPTRPSSKHPKTWSASSRCSRVRASTWPPTAAPAAQGLAEKDLRTINMDNWRLA